MSQLLSKFASLCFSSILAFSGLEDALTVIGESVSLLLLVNRPYRLECLRAHLGNNVLPAPWLAQSS